MRPWVWRHQEQQGAWSTVSQADSGRSIRAGPGLPRNRGDSCGGFALKQDGIVVTLDQAAFGGEIGDVGGVGTLMRQKMVA